jgi:hypothetical protein
MAEEKEKDQLSRREALKGLAAGLGAAGSLPILNNQMLGQQGQAHEGHGRAAQPGTSAKKAEPPTFFTAAQLATVATISELIIPTDDHSPGAKAAEVPAFIDLMVSESSAEIQALWRDGLAALDRMSRERSGRDFNGATVEEQTAMLTEISRNESEPQTVEERFFKAIKNLTIDGYYTSKVGIHQELQYQGNTYLREFKGCTHPEHQS